MFLILLVVLALIGVPIGLLILLGVLKIVF